MYSTRGYLISSEFWDKMVKECVVKVFTTKECVAVSRLDLKDTLLDFKDTDVKSSTAKIVHSNTVKNIYFRLEGDLVTSQLGASQRFIKVL